MFIMLGYEGEEMTDLQATAQMLQEAAPDHFLTTVLYPVKNTPYYEQVSDRIELLPSWEKGSDRDLVVAGKHSPRYYGLATRWLVNRIAWHRLWRERPRRYPALAKALLNIGVGRLGMTLTQGEVSGG
jgi:radical SAM superfamily enzyme YgiQ (UPF0313 family)